jgi:general secretion pathway protein G
MGMRLVQIMVCLVAVVALTIGGCSDESSRVGACVATINALHVALDVWRVDHGRYPTEEEGLKVLLQDMLDGKGGPYLGSTEIPRDPWGNPFRYRLMNDKPLIDSAGPDGTFGTKDDIDRNTKPQQRTSGCMVRAAARP